MRCFAALVPPASFLAALEMALLPYMTGLQGWRLVRPEGIHVTLAFMADAGPVMIDAAVAALQGMAVPAMAVGHERAVQAAVPGVGNWAAPVSLRFGPPTLFPSLARPRVLALEPIQGADELAGLWNGFNGLFHREALARKLPPPNPEWRSGARFRPHLSLARPVNRPGQRPVVRPGQEPAVCHANATASGSSVALYEVFIFDELVLYESIRGYDGPRYIPLAQAFLVQKPLAHASLTGDA